MPRLVKAAGRTAKLGWCVPLCAVVSLRVPKALVPGAVAPARVPLHTGTALAFVRAAPAACIASQQQACMPSKPQELALCVSGMPVVPRVHAHAGACSSSSSAACSRLAQRS